MPPIDVNDGEVVSDVLTGGHCEAVVVVVLRFYFSFQ